MFTKKSTKNIATYIITKKNTFLPNSIKLVTHKKKKKKKKKSTQLTKNIMITLFYEENCFSCN